MDEFVYLYGFVPSGAPTPSDVRGISDAPVQVIAASGEVAAAVSHVPAAEYAPERIEARLRDLVWVAEQGVAHERVVAWFVDHAQILPAPLFTMYSSVDSLRASSSERSAELSEQMRRLRGLREWDVKVSFDRAVLQENASQISEKVAALDEEIASAPAGKSYLLQRKRADLLKVEVRQAAHRRAVDILNQLAELTTQRRTLPLPRTAENLPVVLHAALLVPSEAESRLIKRLNDEAEQLRRIGMDLTFSGPWAPYRFMDQHEQ